MLPNRTASFRPSTESNEEPIKTKNGKVKMTFPFPYLISFNKKNMLFFYT